jgi:hypothetical protein
LRANKTLIVDIQAVSEDARRLNQQTHSGQRVTDETNN